jgi:hypothetical protein
MVLEAAINGGVDTIVTFNVRDFAPGASRFAIQAIGPGAALAYLPRRVN